MFRTLFLINTFFLLSIIYLTSIFVLQKFNIRRIFEFSKIKFMGKIINFYWVFIIDELLFNLWNLEFKARRLWKSTEISTGFPWLTSKLKSISRLLYKYTLSLTYDHQHIMNGLIWISFIQKKFQFISFIFKILKNFFPLQNLHLFYLLNF